MTPHLHRIVILGAGYAGLLATARLAGRMKQEVARRPGLTITLEVGRAHVCGVRVIGNPDELHGL